MPLPERLRKQLEARLGPYLGHQDAGSTLSLGNESLDSTLPDGGLPRGVVTELAIKGGAAWGTSLALASCRSAQQQALLQGGEEAWCAFVDPSRSLYGPGVLRAGVRLDRLLVIVPESRSIAQAALRLVRSRLFAVSVIDLRGIPGAWVDVSLAKWPRIIRQLAAGGEGTPGTVILLTDTNSRRPLPLPVALRLELDQREIGELGVTVVKERHGRLGNRRVVRCQSAVDQCAGVSNCAADGTEEGRIAV